MDIEFKINKFNVGFSYRYYSKMQNIDNALQDIEVLTGGIQFIDDIKGVQYWKTHNGFHIFDARISYKFKKSQKLSLVCNNIFNIDYSLRPLKSVSPRTIALQYVLTF